MSKSFLAGKRILVTGGTGSLGRLLVKRLLSGEVGEPERVIVFSRDEAKQHEMRLQYLRRAAATDEVVFENFEQRLVFWVGDVRDSSSLGSALAQVDVVFHAAALKQVPTCEYFPYEAVQTNVMGAENLVRALEQRRLSVETVVGISTDKACEPVNVMGMTKALQERLLVQANMRCPDTRFVCVRYGNVLASRGSVIPLFQQQIRDGGPVTITSTEMTRFLVTLDEAVDTVLAAVRLGVAGETFVPIVPSGLITDVAAALIGDRPIQTLVTGTRPGEKVHEIMVSQAEAARTMMRERWYAIRSILPEVRSELDGEPALDGEFSSADHVLGAERTAELLRRGGLLVDDTSTDLGLLERSAVPEKRS